MNFDGATMGASLSKGAAVPHRVTDEKDFRLGLCRKQGLKTKGFWFHVSHVQLSEIYWIESDSILSIIMYHRRCEHRSIIILCKGPSQYPASRKRYAKLHAFCKINKMHRASFHQS
jgi:hypothetical protein